MREGCLNPNCKCAPAMETRLTDAERQDLIDNPQKLLTADDIKKRLGVDDDDPDGPKRDNPYSPI